MKNIFVGNLDFSTTEEVVRGLFAAHGTVESVTMVKDRDTGQPRGFAFVEMMQPEEAQAAISSLDGTLLNERVLRVNEARAKLAPDHDSAGNRDHRRHQI